ncbi:MAG: hypothetical protein ABI549_08325 [Flavobacterium sp.]|uniref:hypothetical protein n=1 Tax=Flavobacterium sp. TaxID=239 RepID=UPI003262EB00
MKTISPSLILYLIASFFAILALVINNDSLLLIMKPVIAPAIFYYYLQSRSGKINWIFLIILLFNFMSDMIVLFELSIGDITITLLNMISYLMLIYLVIKDFSVKNTSRRKFFYFLLMMVSCLSVLYVVISMMSNLDNLVLNLYIVYGIILCLLTSIVGLNYLNNPNGKTFYAIVMCICFIISDVFFAIYNFYLNLEIFIILNVIAQFASYYYMVKYVTSNSLS